MKNTKVKWDVRQDFEKHISSIKASFPAFGDIIMSAKTGTYQGKLKASEFYSRFKHVVKETGRHETYVKVEFTDGCVDADVLLMLMFICFEDYDSKLA